MYICIHVYVCICVYMYMYMYLPLGPCALLGVSIGHPGKGGVGLLGAPPSLFFILLQPLASPFFHFVFGSLFFSDFGANLAPTCLPT